jgi:O-succinylbenzoic acid--CoA ligase
MIINSFGQINNVISLVSDKVRLTYPQYVGFISKTADSLKRAGFNSSERVAILSHNNIEFAVLLMALFEVGVIAIPINYQISPKQIANILYEINCSKIVGLKDFMSFKEFVDFDAFDLKKLVSFDGHPRANIDKIEFPLSQHATILFTSGSTGNPKAIMHSIGNHYYSARGSNLNIPFAKDDVWLLSLPLFHVGGLSILFRAVLNGGTVAVPSQKESLKESIFKYRPSHISLVPTQLYRLFQESEVIGYLSSLKAILLGGGPIPRKLVEKSIASSLPIFPSYGSTQMASQVTTTRPGDQKVNLFTCGRVVKYRDVKIAADNEILVKGRTLSKGFVEGDKIIGVRDADGWYHTGDLGEFTANDYLNFIGRKDNMFISGGENIQPEEIEKCLQQLEMVSDAMVIPIRSEEFGRRPVAFIKIKSGKFPNPDFLKSFLFEKLPKFKIPDAFYPWPENEESTGIKSKREYFKKLAEGKRKAQKS